MAFSLLTQCCTALPKTLLAQQLRAVRKYSSEPSLDVIIFYSHLDLMAEVSICMSKIVRAVQDNRTAFFVKLKNLPGKLLSPKASVAPLRVDR